MVSCVTILYYSNKSGCEGSVIVVKGILYGFECCDVNAVLYCNEFEIARSCMTYLIGFILMYFYILLHDETQRVKLNLVFSNFSRNIFLSLLFFCLPKFIYLDISK